MSDFAIRNLIALLKRAVTPANYARMQSEFDELERIIAVESMAKQDREKLHG